MAFSVGNYLTDKVGEFALSMPMADKGIYMAVSAAISQAQKNADPTGQDKLVDGVGVLDFVSICVTSVLSPESLKKIDTFIADDSSFAKLHTKYTLLLKVMNSQKKTLGEFLKEKHDLVEALVSKIGIKEIDEAKLRDDINASVPLIIEMLKSNKPEVEKILNAVNGYGGKRSKRLKRRKRGTKKVYKRK